MTISPKSLPSSFNDKYNLEIIFNLNMKPSDCCVIRSHKVFSRLLHEAIPHYNTSPGSSLPSLGKIAEPLFQMAEVTEDAVKRSVCCRN